MELVSAIVSCLIRCHFDCFNRSIPHSESIKCVFFYTAWNGYAESRRCERMRSWSILRYQFQYV